MPHNCYFFPEKLHEELEITLLDKEFHHLMNVMRLKEGDSLEVINGEGLLATASVQRITKKTAVCKIEKVYVQPPPSYQVILAQAIPRQNRLDTIVEKTTELGITEIWLFPGEKSELATLSASKLDRLKQISISALKQSGRLYLPKISLHPFLSKWKEIPNQTFFGDLSKQAKPLTTLDRNQPICFFIGPESGFSDGELEILKKYTGIRLNDAVLRTDTAAITAVALVNHFRSA